jgi:peptide/nickel transport system substrate-binding protein
MPRSITRATTVLALTGALVAVGLVLRPPRGAPAGQRPKLAHAVPQEEYAPQVGRYGGRMVLPSLGRPKSFNPITVGETSTLAFTQFMFLGLTRMNPWTFAAEPCLATSWTSDEAGLVWTVKLREGVLWSDGEPFTADDVVFTFDTVYDPNIVSSARDALLGPGGRRWKVEKLDDLTVRFTLPAPNAIFAELLYQALISRHKFEQVVRDGRFNDAMGTNCRSEDIPVTGPFMLGSYDGTRVVLKRNGHFYRLDAAGSRLPYLDELMWLVVPDVDTQTLKFQQGETDVAYVMGKDYPSFIRPQKRGDFTLLMLGPAWDESFLTFNQNTGSNPRTGRPYVQPHKLAWYRDVRFRRAISHAMDRKFMADGICNGLAYPQYGPMTLHAEAPMAKADVPRYEYDLDKARALLAGMGLKDRDGDGYLEDEQGRRVEFTLTTNVESTVRAKIAACIRQDLEKVGIRVNLRSMTFNALITVLDFTNDWEACLMTVLGESEPHWRADLWKSSGRNHTWFPQQVRPSTNWEAEVDDIFDRGAAELDVARRREIYARWQVIAAEQQPLLYTVIPEAMVALRSRFGNVFPSRRTFPEAQNAVLHNVEEIYVLPNASTGSQK